MHCSSFSFRSLRYFLIIEISRLDAQSAATTWSREYSQESVADTKSESYYLDPHSSLQFLIRTSKGRFSELLCWVVPVSYYQCS